MYWLPWFVIICAIFSASGYIYIFKKKLKYNKKLKITIITGYTLIFVGLWSVVLYFILK